MSVIQLQHVDDVTKRAEALAKVQEMHDQLTEAHATILQLKADLHREKDRVEMLLEDRDRHRHEAVRFRKLALTLAVKLANAAMILDEAKEAVMEMDEIDAAKTPNSAAIDALEQEYRNGTKA